MKKIIVSALAICLSVSISAQTKTTIDATKNGNTNYEFALNDPYNTRIYTLKNGLKVYLSVYKNAPRIQTMIAVKAGSKNDPATATGLAHYLEHMLFKGTDKFGTKDAAKENAEIKKIEDLYEKYRLITNPTERAFVYHQIDSISGVAAKYAIANEYDKMLSAIGAQGTNAFTSFDQTVYINDIPSNQINNWLAIESERFRKPILRLFHTELEAVYEEKNRGLDDDNRKSIELVFETLFPKNKYGTQTTIGTIEHLKNPSLKEINNFYNKWYVPNNMAIIMSGDFDPDVVIKQIEKEFNSFASKPLDTYTHVKEDPITTKIVKDLYGPDPESISMVWRVEGEGSRDAELAELVSSLLYNNKAGLIDINLNQAQKVMQAYSYPYILKDAGIFILSAAPKQDQKMEDVEKLLYDQIELLRNGTYPDWILNAVITDLKLSKTKELEQNYDRASEMSRAFVNNLKWQEQVEKMERMSKFTKKDISDFVNRNFNANNYVIVKKHVGEDKSVVKVEKPAITPVEVDRDNVSPFVKSIYEAKIKDIEPVFLNYDKDIQKANLKSGIPILYNKNTENKLFEIYFKFDMGNNNDKLASLAVRFIDYLATKDMTSAQIKEQLFKLGCSFNVFNDSEDTWVSLNGLTENFEEALKLFEHVLTNPVIDEESLKNLKEDFIKDREDNKQQKDVILRRGLLSYARYGAINPFTFQLTNEEINAIKPSQIKDKILGLMKYKHTLMYYGPSELQSVVKTLETLHKGPDKGYVDVPAAYKFESRVVANEVYVVDFDMKQAEILMFSNGLNFSEKVIPIVDLYNTYFGDGMSGVVFQDLRESKALAYSVYSRYVQPNSPSKPFYNISYIGSQVDKLEEAMKGMKDLLTVLPKSDASFAAARENLLQEIRSQRINKAAILFNYVNAQKLGLNNDIRKDIFENVTKYTFEDVKKFHSENVVNKNTSILVVGKKENLDFKVLEKYGPVKVLTLKEVFGY